jgi:predicted dehydrogenase
MMSHMVDLAVWLLGPSAGVRLLSRSVLLPERDIDGQRRPVDAEDYCVAEWTAASGARCLVEADLVSPSFMQYVEVHGARGSLFGSLADHLESMVHLTEPAAGLAAGTHRFEEPRIELLDAQWASFADELDQPADGRPLEAALATAAILDALQLDRSNPPARSV